MSKKPEDFPFVQGAQYRLPSGLIAAFRWVRFQLGVPVATFEYVRVENHLDRRSALAEQVTLGPRNWHMAVRVGGE